MTGRQAVFGSLPVFCAECTVRTLPYLVGRSHATKVAALSYGVSANSKACGKSAKDSVEKYAADIGGAEVVYFNDDLPFGLPNGIGPEVTAMKAAGVQFILTCTDLNAMKALGQELRRQGMSDVVMAHPNSYDQSFVDSADGIFEGDYVTAQFRPFEATPNEAQQKFQEYIAKVGAEPTELAMTGWINATTAVEGLLAAGPDFDRQKVIDATNRLTADTAGGLVNPINWTQAHNPPTQDEPASGGWAQECLAAVQVVDGTFKTIADPATPFLCWSNANRDWSEPEQHSFDANSVRGAEHLVPQEHRARTVAALVRSAPVTPTPGCASRANVGRGPRSSSRWRCEARFLEQLVPAEPRHFGVLLDNVPEYLFLLGGAALSGRALVALNPTRRGAELARDIRHADCQAIVTDSEHIELLDGLVLGPADDNVLVADLPDYPERLAPHRGPGASPTAATPGPDDLLLLIFTSGSTGAPKAVRMTQGRAAENSGAALGFGPEDVLYCRDAGLPRQHAQLDGVPVHGHRGIVGVETPILGVGLPG